MEILEAAISCTVPSTETEILNVTVLEPRLKHPTVFDLYDSLKPGEQFYILNDHDPKPLYYQMIAERGNYFAWTYEEKGPTWWKVLIKKNRLEELPTVGELAASDIRKAEVFKKYGIDFCCGGKKTLKQACDELQLDVNKIESEIEIAHVTETTKGFFDFNSWEPDFLADYIYNQHHIYYYQNRPVIADLLEKVVNHHGVNYPELMPLYNLVNTLQQELNAHFIKEEKVLFPFIKNLANAKRTNTFPMPIGIDSIDGPVQMMEADHEAAGEILAEMQKLTNNYTPPAGACNSFSLLYSKLKALDEDLHQHIHLENNILFKKALSMSREFKS